MQLQLFSIEKDVKIFILERMYLHQMILVKLDVLPMWGRLKVDQQMSPITGIKIPNVKTQTLKLLENKDSTLHYVGLGKDFMNRIPYA